MLMRRCGSHNERRLLLLPPLLSMLLPLSCIRVLSVALLVLVSRLVALPRLSVCAAAVKHAVVAAHAVNMRLVTAAALVAVER